MNRKFGVWVQCWQIGLLSSFLFIASFNFESHANLLADEELPPLPKGPLILTSIRPEQLTADYWINRLPNPDKLVKTPEELRKFNREITTTIQERVDIFRLKTERDGVSMRKLLEFEFKTVSNRFLFGANGKRILASLFNQEIKPLVASETVPKKINLKWGIATQATSVRALPTLVKMLEASDDIEFDQLQFTLIKLWTPVAILHESPNGKWYYIQAPYVRGWVLAKDIARTSTRGELKKLVEGDDFLVVTGESIPIYFDSDFAQFEYQPSMGTRLPLASIQEKHYVIWMPLRGSEGEVSLRKSYVSIQSDVSHGFLPLTQRNVIRQAFKLLGARYGWGGMYNGRDCSGFTHDVFLSVGVDMPRDSKQQAFVGTQLGHFPPHEGESEKIAALRSGLPGFTLLRMSLHMMLYLGEEDGNFYVIHSTWAERVSMTSDEKRRINQVVVSDMTLNGKSYLGPLFDRVISINEVN